VRRINHGERRHNRETWLRNSRAPVALSRVEGRPVQLDVRATAKLRPLARRSTAAVGGRQRGGSARDHRKLFAIDQLPPRFAAASRLHAALESSAPRTHV